MHLLPIQVSKKQLHKLRKGGAVRIKMGTGFNLIVNPTNYRLATKAFGQNKGLEIKLSPEELEANRGVSPEQHAALREAAKASELFGHLPMAGAGIFDDISSGFHQYVKPVLHEAYKEVEPDLKQAAKDAAREYIKGKGVSHKDLEHMNHLLGTNMGYMRRANLGKYSADELGSRIDSLGFDAKHRVAPIKTYWDDTFEPPSRGTGIRHHHMTALPYMARRGRGMIKGRGNLSHHNAILPPALQSQPYGVNFHMQFQLPPQYQKFNRGVNDIGRDIGGSGLYA
mgnify:CR=1 FL=1